MSSLNTSNANMKYVLPPPGYSPEHHIQHNIYMNVIARLSKAIVHNTVGILMTETIAHSNLSLPFIDKCSSPSQSDAREIC